MNESELNVSISKVVLSAHVSKALLPIQMEVTLLVMISTNVLIQMNLHVAPILFVIITTVDLNVDVNPDSGTGELMFF